MISNLDGVFTIFKLHKIFFKHVKGSFINVEW